MRVRVTYTVDVDDEYRRAIRRYHGDDGLATRAEVQDWFKLKGFTMDDDLAHDHGDVTADDDEGIE
jgi:hypothetical protein